MAPTQWECVIRLMVELKRSSSMWKLWKMRSSLSLLVQGSPLREPARPCSGSAQDPAHCVGTRWSEWHCPDYRSVPVGQMTVTETLQFDSECLRTCNLTIAYSSMTSHKWCKCEQEVPTRALTLRTVHRNPQCRLCLIWIKVKLLPNILPTKVEANNGSQ